MQAKKTVPVIIFTLAAVVLLIGIVQLILVIPPQINMLNNAWIQGSSNTDISNYIWQQLIPQIFSYVITSFGITFVLIACGLISWQSIRTRSIQANPQGNDKPLQPSGQPLPQSSEQPAGQPNQQPPWQPVAQNAVQPADQTAWQPAGQNIGQPLNQATLQPTDHPMAQTAWQPTTQSNWQPVPAPESFAIPASPGGQSTSAFSASPQTGVPNQIPASTSKTSEDDQEDEDDFFKDFEPVENSPASDDATQSTLLGKKPQSPDHSPDHSPDSPPENQ